jgi:hypothetical protein
MALNRDTMIDELVDAGEQSADLAKLTDRDIEKKYKVHKTGHRPLRLREVLLWQMALADLKELARAKGITLAATSSKEDVIKKLLSEE